MRWKSWRVAAAVASIAVLGACSSTAQEAGSNTSGSSGAGGSGSAFQTVTPGVLTVATNVGSVGWMNGTDQENPTGGVEYEIAKALADKYGLTMKFTHVGFTPLISGAIDNYDIGLESIFVTPERQKVNQYSICHSDSPQALVVPKDTEITDQTQMKDLAVGYLTGSWPQKLVDRLDPKEKKGYQDATTEFAALKSKSVDALVEGLLSASGRLQKPEYSDFKIAATLTLDGEELPCVGAQLPKSAPASNVEAVNDVITTAKNNGDYAKWVKEYMEPLGADPSKYPAIVIK